MGSKKQRNASAVARPDTTVIVGFCHGDRIHPQWQASMTGVLVRDLLTTRRIIGEIRGPASGAHVATARSKIVRQFLSHPQQPEWLWIVDTDATFPPTILDQLLDSAHPVDRPIVGALAFGLQPAKDANGQETVNMTGGSTLVAFPTLYLFNEQGQALRIWSYPRDTLVEVHGTGCHCLLIHRSVLEHEIWDTSHPLPWFRSGTVMNGGEVSEDLFFCLEARRAGFRLHVDTGAKTGHVKEFVVDEAFFDSQAAYRDAVGQVGGTNGIAEIVLIVPSRGRPRQAGELADSWRATTTGRSVLAVCVDDDDDLTAYQAAVGPGVHVLVGPRQQMCPWTNDIAVEAAAGGARIVASLGDDHRLVGDWESLVLAAVDDAGGTAIVYGDDGIQGERLPTAAFVSADIVAALGWMCLPGLEHLYCDNVWKTLGERAGVLRYLPELSTPHLHPVAGLAPMDESYASSNSEAQYQRDGAVFRAWLQDGGADRDASIVANLVRVPA